jgi:hypothetical protein
MYHNKLVDYERDQSHLAWAMQSMGAERTHELKAQKRGSVMFHSEVLTMAEAHKASLTLNAASIKEIAGIDTAGYTKDMIAVVDCVCIFLSGDESCESPDEVRGVSAQSLVARC